MRSLRFAVLLCLFLTACAEQFISENAQQINEKISQRKDISAPDELAKIYLQNKYQEFDLEKFQISSQRITHNEYEISIIQNLSDDSIAAEKTVLKVKNDNLIWRITEIRRNWKCHEGRGHTNWGTASCV